MSKTLVGLLASQFGIGSSLGMIGSAHLGKVEWMNTTKYGKDNDRIFLTETFMSFLMRVSNGSF
jgi:hypothetical protein